MQNKELPQRNYPSFRIPQPSKCVEKEEENRGIQNIFLESLWMVFAWAKTPKKFSVGTHCWWEADHVPWKDPWLIPIVYYYSEGTLWLFFKVVPWVVYCVDCAKGAASIANIETSKEECGSRGSWEGGASCQWSLRPLPILPLLSAIRVWFCKVANFKTCKTFIGGFWILYPLSHQALSRVESLIFFGSCFGSLMTT